MDAMTLGSLNRREPRTRPTSLVLLFTLALLGFAGLSACGAGMEAEVAKQADYHYQLAVNNFGANQATQAIRELTATLEADPKHPEALHLLGFIYMGRKQYPEAIRNFRAALEVKPDYYICKNNLGVAYLYMERWDEAAEVFAELRTATLYTSPWLAYANLGWAYYQMGRLSEAVEETKMALFLNPEMCLASNNLGIMYHDQTNYEDAQMSFEEAIEACPGYAEPHLHLGQLWAEAGDDSKAFSHYRKCTELSPKSDMGQRCRKKMKAYR
ncbi:MAG: hypothetical protein AUK47_07495 [Deltaproteobacteria bacterium CG2_30_63_29]|nr:MAG: hypothetical protein AUK47_07495 [Deltaproteobacteria bacterium CG2_30_63_29]